MLGGILVVTMPDMLTKIAIWGALILGAFIGLYLLLALALLVCLGTFAGVSNLLRELGVQRKMRAAGRFLPWRMALERIEHSGGTLILESPTIGWAVTRAWWTPDDVLAQTPTPPPDKSERDHSVLSRHPFIEWCHDHYTDLDHGTGYLLATYNGHRCANRLMVRFPGLKNIGLWSGAVSLRDLPPSGV